ncbi:Insect cuticle protein [Oryctes borbonicus]|uniref:Insect cuticle protein n=1 Tax=Oryctes borbonicus TaxID=1629725 RepID=A0A0T6B5P7_9SCAR|nr:Insect cuticle protein [Oryctes borbonicus]
MLKYLFLLSAISGGLSQYHGDREGYNQPSAQYSNYDEDRRSRLFPQILSHKQSLNHDGNFKYAFASDNGLLQGESIAPDGSRTGAYAYVDPSGRKISVKYKAGKEGFKILEGDHIPKAHPLLDAASQRPHPGYGGSGGDEGFVPHSEGRRPIYEPPPGLEQYRTQAFRPSGPIDGGIYDKSRGLNRPPMPPERSNEVLPFPVAQRYKSLDDREPEYNDEPGKPNSFGSGYSFEFGGK